jgi:ABC-2 type transport system ATP-binding protein
MSDLAMQFDNVTVACGNRRLLDRLSLTVPIGGITAVVGPNGSGKTTTLRVMAGLLRPSDGRLVVLGHDIADQIPGWQRLVGFVPDRDGLYEDITVRDTLVGAAKLWGVPGNSVDQVLAQLGLDERRDDWCGTLSSGYRRRVALARALIGNPDVLLLDEVTNSLDLPSRNYFYNWLRSNRPPTSSVVLATHNAWEAATLCDHYVVLSDGRALFNGPRADLIPDEDSPEAFEKAIVRLIPES